MTMEPGTSQARRARPALLAVAISLGVVGLSVWTVFHGSGDLEAEVVDTPPVAASESGDAALVVAPDSGVVYFAWVEGDSGGRRVQFARSSDGGASWSQPVTVSAGPDDVGPAHGEASPRLVTGGAGQVALVWSRSVVVPGRQWPASMIRFSRSVDGGASWSTPVTLNDDSTSAPGTHTFHGVGWSEQAGLVAAWLDERGGEGFPGHHHTVGDPVAAVSIESDARIYMTSSADFGGSWTANQAVWGGVCPCCRVALAP
ncbi:MAG TPA: sialidase family protein, partial [Gemmatimonadales bacterium]|nr:sialidase family protein [Gemmatimonadales bacterium]